MATVQFKVSFDVAPPVTAPVNTTLPVISGSVQTSATLTATPGSWTNSPAGFAYEWQRDGTAILGATAVTYQLVAADQGREIRVAVTASNATGATQAISDAVVPIGVSGAFEVWSVFG